VVCLVEKGDFVWVISVVNSASSPLPTLSLSLHSALKSDISEADIVSVRRATTLEREVESMVSG
jgi:hypothetical protein